MSKNTVTQFNAIANLYNFASDNLDLFSQYITENNVTWTAEDVLENVAHQLTKRQETAAKVKSQRSNAPSKTYLRNMQLVSEVVVPLVNATDGIMTAKNLADRAGHPEILTSQKAAILLDLAFKEGNIQREKYQNKWYYANMAYDLAGTIAEMERKRQERKSSKKES